MYIGWGHGCQLADRYYPVVREERVWVLRQITISRQWEDDSAVLYASDAQKDLIIINGDQDQSERQELQFVEDQVPMEQLPARTAQTDNHHIQPHLPTSVPADRPRIGEIPPYHLIWDLVKRRETLILIKAQQDYASLAPEFKKLISFLQTKFEGNLLELAVLPTQWPAQTRFVSNLATRQGHPRDQQRPELLPVFLQTERAYPDKAKANRTNNPGRITDVKVNRTAD